MRSARLSLVALCLSACAFHQAPYVMYTDKSHPWSDTAVFSTRGTKGNALGQIVSVDGVETSCWQVGCPIWVRVLPGSHTFELRLSIYDNGIDSYLRGDGSFEVKGMQPRHVYEANFLVSPERDHFTMQASDLGENPDYGVTLYLSHTYYRVRFDDGAR
jgi:hypothetical protein